MNILNQENLEIEYNTILNQYISILKNKYSNIDSLFTYWSYSRWDIKKWSDIDIFLILDTDNVYHDFIIDDIDWVQITTEVLDKNNFYNNIFDNRLIQANIIIDNFYSEEQIQERVLKRKKILIEILSKYNDLSEIEKTLSIFTFIKIYSLIVMDLKKKIPSKKIEYNEVLDFLDNNNIKKSYWWIYLKISIE